MSYQKQGFYSGGDLYASQLDAMEDGIINAETIADNASTLAAEAKELAQVGAAGAANMEKGTNEGSSQQVGDPSRVVDGKWDFGERNPNAGDDNDSFKGKQDYGATGIYSATFGGSNRASGSRSFAINNRTIAAGDESLAQGYCTVAAGPSSFAGGSLTYAKGEASVALGGNTVAAGKASTALGEHSYALGQDSFVAGDHCEAYGHAQIVVGRYNESAIAADPDAGILFEVGNGNSSQRSSAFMVHESQGTYVQTALQVEGSIQAENIQTNHIQTNGIQLEGEIQAQSIKVGENIINTEKSIVFQNSGAVSLGAGSVASGPTSAAIGGACQATSDMSTAIGHKSKATAPVATAIGQYINAGYDHQVAIGRFNDNKATTLFEVGGGHADDNRLNVFEVYADGDIGIRFNGKTYSLQKMLASYFIDTNLK